MPRQRSIQLSIPEPCAQSWAAMQTGDGGRFCAHCQKTVVDYSAMSDAAVVRHIAEHGLGCGRFRQDQLERELVGVQLEKRNWQKWLIAGLSAVFSFGVREADASVHKTEDVKAFVRPANEALQYCSGTKDASISGSVLDEEGEPLINAFIVVTDQYGNNLGGTVTDFEGKFEIVLFKVAVEKVDLTASYQGRHQTIKGVKINTKQVSLNINTVKSSKQVTVTVRHLTGLVGPKPTKKKTFWQKLQFWHRR